ncbi:MAG TPA: hypothetical protein VHQ47_16670 [Phycisphaerae bacterium]|nr:hypothetical protein [Phycisphaerae bacterium]
MNAQPWLPPHFFEFTARARYHFRSRSGSRVILRSRPLAIFFVGIISVGIVVGTGVYIGVMNKIWYDKQRDDRQPPPPRD